MVSARVQWLFAVLLCALCFVFIVSSKGLRRPMEDNIRVGRRVEQRHNLRVVT